MKQVSSRTLITIFFTVALGVIGFFVVATYRNVKETQEQNKQTDKSLRFLLLTSKLLGDVQKLNAAQRGFIFSSPGEYRAHYEKATDELLSDTSLLDDLLLQDGEREKDVTDIKRLIGKKVAESKKTITSFTEGGLPAAMAEIKNEVAGGVGDSLRESIGSVEISDQYIINRSNRYLETTAQKTSDRFFLLSLIAVTILLSFLPVIYFDFKKRKKLPPNSGTRHPLSKPSLMRFSQPTRTTLYNHGTMRQPNYMAFRNRKP